MRDYLADPAYGFSGMLQALGDFAEAYAVNAVNEDDPRLGKDYRWLRDRLDSLSKVANKRRL